MKPISFIFLFALLLWNGCGLGNKAQHPNTREGQTVFFLDFEHNDVGSYLEDALLKDAGELNWMSLENRATIVNDGQRGKVLKVLYPMGAVGPEKGGIQFDKPLPKSQEYYLEYHLKFSESFDFALGGKLPGLTSGGETYTGGNKPIEGDGWSTRYMWVEQGELVVYFYHLGMQHQWGDALETHTFLVPGKWYRLTQHITLNDGDQANGSIRVWVDGKKVLEDSTIQYRMAPKGLIDSFYFSTFHGGNTPDWAPEKDAFIYFDTFNVTTQRPDGLE
ncbi:MAG: polysaccharide lyase [Flavobacteriaceae bacterium]